MFSTIKSSNDFSPSYKFHNIIAYSVDLLVKQGINHINEYGDSIESRAGNAKQAYGVNYILTNPRNRIHFLRKEAKKYLYRELFRENY